MGQDMLISVIVPVYNVEKYLRICIDSLLAQTYKNIEIIMVDDGSKDASGEICDEYAYKYEKCKVVHKKNAGLGMARNTGMENMEGEYVTFVDSDDWLMPDTIENLFRALMDNGVDMCKGGFQRVNNGKIISIRKYQEECFKGEKAKNELLPRMIGSSPTEHDSIEMCVWGAIYKTDIIKKHNLKFVSERELISEDLVFNIDYMQFANGACTIGQTGYQYRLNNSSLSTSYRADRYQASVYFYKEMAKKIKELGYDNFVMLRLKRMFFIYLRMSIFQEVHLVSKLTMRQNVANIKSMCSDSIISEILNDYPVKKMGFKQVMFLELVRHRCAVTLFCFATLTALKKKGLFNGCKKDN